ncbi:hypothetical protein GCM10029964_118970 [Kibdelosporangium lantanae]
MDLPQDLGDLRIGLEDVLGHTDPQHHRGDVVGHEVVQFAGDGRTFLRACRLGVGRRAFLACQAISCNERMCRPSRTGAPTSRTDRNSSGTRSADSGLNSVANRTAPAPTHVRHPPRRQASSPRENRLTMFTTPTPSRTYGTPASRTACSTTTASGHRPPPSNNRVEATAIDQSAKSGWYGPFSRLR